MIIKILPLHIQYENIGEIANDSLKNFLMERYCIWNVRGKQIIKVPISHSKWTVQKLETDVKKNELFVNLKLPFTKPITYYCHDKHAKLYPFEILAIFEN